MNTALLYALVGVGLFALGLYALIAYDHLLRKILALNVMGSGIFLVLVGAAGRSAGNAPDPVPQAMVITGIVVAVSATALGLTLMLRLREASGSATLAAQNHDRAPHEDSQQSPLSPPGQPHQPPAQPSPERRPH